MGKLTWDGIRNNGKLLLPGVCKCEGKEKIPGGRELSCMEV